MNSIFFIDPLQENLLMIVPAHIKHAYGNRIILFSDSQNRVAAEFSAFVRDWKTSQQARNHPSPPQRKMGVFCSLCVQMHCLPVCVYSIAIQIPMKCCRVSLLDILLRKNMINHQIIQNIILLLLIAVPFNLGHFIVF